MTLDPHFKKRTENERILVTLIAHIYANVIAFNHWSEYRKDELAKSFERMIVEYLLMIDPPYDISRTKDE